MANILEGDLDAWLAAFRAQGVLAVAFGPNRMRMVTHLNITSENIADALGGIERAVAATSL